MYSGTTLTKISGSILGTHQKIDRVARKHLSLITGSDVRFPSAREILRFEGNNGPDGIKRKSPAQDEPWHFFDPFDENDQEIIEIITSHYKNLIKDIREKNNEKTAFEAAWLAHAIVDGLTPAHHFPYEEKLTELRKGASKESRVTVKEKLVLPGDTVGQMVKNNWKMWGPKGLFVNHGLFEMGVASIIMPLRFKDSLPTSEDISRAKDVGVIENFKAAARQIASLDFYERYEKNGWSTKLSFDVKHKLMPLIIETVTLTWYMALSEAKVVK